MKSLQNRLILGILLSISLSMNQALWSQNLQKKDSLLKHLKQKDLTLEERTKTLRYIAYFHPNFSEGLRYAKQSYAMAQEIDAPILQAEALEEIGHLERLLGNNDKSFEASLRALRLYEEEGLTERQAASYTQLANNHISNEDYPSAINYLQKALVIYVDKPTAYASTLLNLGETFRLHHALDSAEVTFKKVLLLNKSIKDPYIESYAQGNLGMVHAANHNTKLAKNALNTAIAHLQPLGDAYSTSIYKAELGEVYQQEGNINLALSQYLESLAIAKEAGLKEQIRDISGALRSSYEATGDYKEALTYQKTYQVYQDSLVNKQNVQKIEQLKAGYEIEKRESEISLLNTINKNQRLSLFMLGVGLLILVIFAYALFQSRKIIKEREKEKALLLSELNHRVKNNLQMISSLLNLQSKQLTGHPAKEALQASQLRVEALSLVHRKLYQEGMSTKVPLKEYIEDLVQGLFHGYNANFKPQFNIEDITISIDSAIPIALIINELVINSLKYAYETQPNPALQIKIAHSKLEMLHIDYKDNGKGFDLENVKAKNSFGINIITTMTQQLKGTIEKVASNGTHWKLTLAIA